MVYTSYIWYGFQGKVQFVIYSYDYLALVINEFDAKSYGNLVIMVWYGWRRQIRQFGSPYRYLGSITNHSILTTQYFNKKNDKMLEKIITINLMNKKICGKNVLESC